MSFDEKIQNEVSFSSPRFIESSSFPNLLGALFIFSFVMGFVSLKLATHGMSKIHLLFIGSIFICYFMHPLSRRLLLIALPIVLYALMYDFFQYIPFKALLPIHVLGPYQIDQNLFGISQGGHLYHFHQFLFRVFNHPILDVYCGFIYLLHVPVVLLLLISFWKFSSDELAAQFALAFLVMNIFAFATYYFYPSAAPWFVAKYGFWQPLSPVPGDAAGLVRFDEILGLNLFTSNYQISPVPFGAIPSMHAGFATLGFLYSFQLNRKLPWLLGLYCLSMCFSALYLQHHYGIDLLLGIFYALFSYLITENFLKVPFLKGFRFVKKHLIDRSLYTFF